MLLGQLRRAKERSFYAVRERHKENFPMVGGVKANRLFAVLVVWALLLGAVLADGKPAGAVLTAADALKLFEEAWKPRQGYMRPLDDSGWKARMAAFQKLVSLGDKSLAVLTDALPKGEPETRVFAAQALALLAEPASRPALEQAVKDSVPAVRLYAIDALSMFGRLEHSALYRQLRDKDTNRDVRSHTAFALERDDKPQPAATQKALMEYDLAGLDTARLGKPAPDFSLADPVGKTYRLSQFRGKMAVVLVFVYGDT